MENSNKFIKLAVLSETSFATVCLVTLQNPNYFDKLPPLLVTKSSSTSPSTKFLLHERDVLIALQDCSQIVTYYGFDEYMRTPSHQHHSLSLFLEFAPGGTLRDLIKKNSSKTSYGGLSENDVKLYTLMLLKGIYHIHSKGYVHCDIKPSNVLVFPCASSFKNRLKISDFGLSLKEVAQEGVQANTEMRYRGTAMYNSPESVAFSKYEKPMDIWALGCTVIEMVTGKPAWMKFDRVSDLLFELAFGDESPEIPMHGEGFSKEGVDFLCKCLMRDPRDRWTAEMLLKHPFVLVAEEEMKLVEDEILDEAIGHWFDACMGESWKQEIDIK